MAAFIDLSPARLLEIAYAEAQQSLSEGGIPIGAALFTSDGTLLGRGHNRRVQNDDPSVHGETDAFRNAGRHTDYRSTIMVTTLAPCWYCSGLIRQFNIGAVIVGENTTFRGGEDWLTDLGVSVTVLNDQRCIAMMTSFIDLNPQLWNEDIGVAEAEMGSSGSRERPTERRAAP